MISVGITGGIGSGKTTVSRLWETLGAYCLNADDLAKEIMVSDPDVKQRIRETFGAESYREDGSLNRKYLADQAFARGRVEELNAIVHPRIPAKTKEIMERANRDGYRVFAYEAALLFENLEPGQLDYVVLVLADSEKRLERVTERDGVRSDEVLQRMENQQDFEKLTGRADFVIYNNGSLEQLEDKARNLYRDILESDSE